MMRGSELYNSHLYWLCINQESPHTGTLSMYHNSMVRVLANETMLRGKPDTQPGV